MKILCSADESGSVKVIDCYKGTDTSKQDAPKPESIESVCVQGRNARVLQIAVWRESLVVTRANGTIELYKEYEIEQKHNIDGEGEFVSLFIHKDKCYAAKSDGQLAILDTPESTPKLIDLKQKPISFLVADEHHEDIFAVGGDKNPLKVIKLTEDDAEVLYETKTPRDRLQLQEKVWPTDALFLESQEGTYKLVEVNKYGKLRVYDSTRGRKPIKNWQISEKGLLHLASIPGKPEMICSDAGIMTARYNYETGRIMGKYRGPVGCTQSIDINRDIVATGGFDRYLRVYDLASREVLANIYLGTQIHAVKIINGLPNREEIKKKREERKKIQQEESDESADEMWEKIQDTETVENTPDTRVRRKRRRLETK